MKPGDRVRCVLDWPEFTGAPVFGQEYVVIETRHTKGFGLLVTVAGHPKEWGAAWFEEIRHEDR